MDANRKDNTGALFVNVNRKNDNHPNWSGSALINGQNFWISAWDKNSKDGDPYYSLSFRPKEDK